MIWPKVKCELASLPKQTRYYKYYKILQYRQALCEVEPREVRPPTPPDLRVVHPGSLRLGSEGPHNEYLLNSTENVNLRWRWETGRRERDTGQA